MSKKPSRKGWRPVQLKVPTGIRSRIDKILERKPHWTQQAIMIDAIEAGLAEVEAREKVG